MTNETYSSFSAVVNNITTKFVAFINPENNGSCILLVIQLFVIFPFNIMVTQQFYIFLKISWILDKLIKTIQDGGRSYQNLKIVLYF